MKILLKFWMRDKKASIQVVSSGLLLTLYSFLNTRLILEINSALSNYTNIREGLFRVSTCLFGMIFFSYSQQLLRKYSLYNVYITNCNKLGDKVLDSDVELFIKHSCAHISIMQGAITELAQAGWGVVQMISNIILIGIILYSAYQVGGLIVIPIVGVYLITFALTKVLYKIYGRLSMKIAEITKIRNQELENMIYGFMEVRSFQTQEIHRNRLRKLNQDRNIESVKKAHITACLGGGFEIIDGIAVIVAITLSSKSIIAGNMSVADGITLVMLIFRIINPLIYTLDFVDEFSDSIKHAADLEELLTYKEPIESGDLILSSFKKSIQIQNISFAYGDAANTLENVSMTIHKGDRIGICGESGGGKSTLFRLINKLYKPSSGKILIDGTDIWDLTNDSYRKFIGSVHQENTMFPGTIRDNIIYGSPNAMEHQIIDACKKAHIYDFIMGLPNKFETDIGPRGLVLSTGQKQRIALARLMLVDPEIILLDEATSALDNESEAFIQDAINSLQGKTIITIAHRLSTIWNSDQIYVIGDHGIIEHGTHDELMKLEGDYYKLNKRKGGTN